MPPSPPWNLKVIVSPDRMEARAQITFSGRGPAPATPRRDTVEHLLAQHGVRHGLIPDASAQLASHPGAWLLVARGTPPVPPSPAGWYAAGTTACLWPPPGAPPAEARVSRGDAIARWEPPRPARDGRDVTGRALPSLSPTRWRTVVPGVGVRPEEDCLRATRAGYLVAEQDRDIVWLSVKPLRSLTEEPPTHGVFALGLWHRGPVSGMHLSGHGDVVIVGHVTDCILTTSAGHLTIHGSAVRSVLRAAPPTAYARARAYLSSLAEGLPRLRATVEQIAAHPRFRTGDWEHAGLGKLIATLLRHPLFQDLRAPAPEVDETLLPYAWTEVLREASSLLQGSSSTPSTEQLASVFRRVQFLLDHRTTCVSATVRVQYLQNCQVQVEGDAVITGAGAYYSHIESSRCILAPLGVFRGCTLAAGVGIVVEELGPVETGPQPAAVAERWLRARCIKPETLVKIGGLPMYFDKETRNVEIVKRDDELSIQHWSTAGNLSYVRAVELCDPRVAGGGIPHG